MDEVWMFSTIDSGRELTLGKTDSGFKSTYLSVYGMEESIAKI